MRLIEPSAGRVVFEGKDITNASASRAAPGAPAHADGVPGPAQLAQPAAHHPADRCRAARRQRPRSARRRTAARWSLQLLDSVGLSPSVMGRYPHQFSGGQRQRVGIARAIALGPSLDRGGRAASRRSTSRSRRRSSISCRTCRSRGGSPTCSSAHDLAVVRHIADRVAVMYLGRIVEIGPKAEVFRAPHHPYTQALLSAAPEARPCAVAEAHRAVG